MAKNHKEKQNHRASCGPLSLCSSRRDGEPETRHGPGWGLPPAASKPQCSIDTSEATHPLKPDLVCSFPWDPRINELFLHQGATMTLTSCSHLRLIQDFLGSCPDKELLRKLNIFVLSDFQCGRAGCTPVSQLGRQDLLHSSYLAGNMQSCSRYSLFLTIW